jgi:hypothetical protein
MDCKLRAWWSHRQGLDGSLAGNSAAESLRQTGWARSVGGSSPYLTLFARAGLRRSDIDTALEKIEIQELPGPRGCTYVVPAADFALALASGHPFSGDEMKVAVKLGVTTAEIDKLSAAILQALAPGPMEPDELKVKVGKAARSLGPDGAKKGIASTLPVALGLLQAEGEIRRVSLDGRIDRQRYRYTLWNPNPLAKWKKSSPGSFLELARRYFGWIGPASLAEFQWFSGLGVKAAKDAVAPLKLTSVHADLHLLPEDAEAFARFEAPRRPQYSLVGNLDGVSHLRRDVQSLVAIEDRQRGFIGSKGPRVDLPNHAILDRGRVVGLWEFDPDSARIVWHSFVARDKEMENAVHATEAFIREDLGDARSFSLDSPARRAPRIEELRKAASA